MCNTSVLTKLQDLYTDPTTDKKYREALITAMKSLTAWKEVMRDIDYNKNLYTSQSINWIYLNEGLDIALKIINKYLLEDNENSEKIV